MTPSGIVHVAATLLLAVACQAAQAGRSCEPRPLTAAGIQRSLDLAARTAQKLDATGADVVVLARAGQDLRRYGLRYSHLGLAYRDRSSGHWRVAHKLNHCGSKRAAVYRQGLGEFFLDDMHEYRAALVVLEPAVQARLLPVLHDNQRLGRVHSAAYSMVAYPWAQTYQQSNQWAIETLAMAQHPRIVTRQQAQAWLQLAGYEPGTLRLGALTRLGARITAANVTFDDHPPGKRYGNRIETVTVDSVFAWLQRSALGQPVQVVNLYAP